SQAESLGGVEIDYQLEPRRLLDRQIGRFGARQNLRDIARREPRILDQVGSVARQRAPFPSPRKRPAAGAQGRILGASVPDSIGSFCTSTASLAEVSIAPRAAVSSAGVAASRRRRAMPTVLAAASALANRFARSGVRAGSTRKAARDTEGAI